MDDRILFMSEELLGVILVPVDDTLGTFGMAPCDQRRRELYFGMDSCQGPLLFSTYGCGDGIN